MSLSSWALVMAHHRRPGNAAAGYLYLLMASFGTLALLLAFGLLAGAAGGYAFEAMRTAMPSTKVAGAVLALALVGAGSKAGVVPLHVWLPLAHPAAPSHVSALMSGVMIKLGVYGLIRISLDWLGDGPLWWGAVILLAGAVSAMVGVLSAIVDRDLKRVLAFSSIENVGIILIGLGAGVLYHAAGLPALAVIGLTAALYHAVNHTAFKTLLFLGAGAVVPATGTRDMAALGGLIN